MSIDGEIRIWLQKSLEVEVHKAGRGNPQALIDWYNAGADGQIQWGEHGDFDACVAIAGKYLDNPEGFCQLRHIDATGEPTGKAPAEIEKGIDESLADILRHDKGHDDWHAMHGDPPCKSEADCARMRAKYKEVKEEEAVSKGDLPGHPFRGNQYSEGLVFTKPDKALVTNTIPTNVGHRDFDINTTIGQIGRMNIAAASGGRVSTITGPKGGDPIGLELPVGSGYRVRVYLADNDTYTVQRVYHTAARETVKGALTDVYADQLGETVYDASCYVNVPFGGDDLAD